MVSLSEIASNAKRLKPTPTIVRKRDGNTKVDRKELLSSSEGENRIAASEKAGKIREDPDQRFITPPRSQFLPSNDGEVYAFVSDDGDDGNVKNGRWEVVPRTASSKLDGSRSITVATFNVWFGEHEYKSRTEALLELLGNKEDIDVICIQEVTPWWLAEVLRKEEIRKAYCITDRGPGYQTLGSSYGVAMLIRKTLPVPEIVWITLPTRMGRSALVASFEIPKNNQPDNSIGTSKASRLAIATVHLESLSFRTTRTKQLSRIHTILERYPIAVLAGDYNISATGPYGNASEHRELNTVMEGYDDLWTKEHGADGDNEGSSEFLRHITFNSTSNAMLKAMKRAHGQPLDHARLDRVFARSDPGCAFRANSIRIVGDKPIGPPNVYISDHFGLVFRIAPIAIPAP